MAWRQLVKPNPNVACKPGWCERYVENTIGKTGKYATATAAWNAEANKHTDRTVPGVWVPVYWGLTNNVAGHTALMAPDGRIYSSSHPTRTTPTIHANLAAIEKYYGGRLKWRGWGENIAGRRVVEQYTPSGSNKVTVYGTKYISTDPIIGRVAAFLRANFPAYTPAAALGNYAGPNFTKALKQFQTNCKIKSDGCFTINGETWNKLKSYGFKG